MKKGFYIQTFGCQMNERDSETIAGILSQKEFVEVDKKEEADVVIINTCSVRENADQRFFGTLGQFKKTKEKRIKEDKDYIICVCGCMMQQQHIVNKLKESYPWVDIVFGTHNINNFPKLLEMTMEERKKRAINAKGGLFEIFEDAEGIVENLPSKRMYKHKAFVTIMYGCNNFCTYCIVPYTRGREKSRSRIEILKEIKELEATGCKEITLLGQNVNSYKDGELSFPQLLELIEKETDIRRVRFMTSHPKDLSDNLIEVYKNSTNLCQSIHLPVQSGSTKILKKMNRGYTKEDYLKILSKIKEARQDIAVTTDIIVGFPGETEEDFEETLDLVRKAEFHTAFTFIYSPRKGTPAEKYEDQVPEEIKHERFNRLVELVNEIGEKKNKERIEKVEEVLVDGVSKTDKEVLTGRTSQFKTVNFKVPEGERREKYIGEIIKVKIKETNTFCLTGEVN